MRKWIDVRLFLTILLAIIAVKVIAFLVAAAYLVTQTQQFKDLLGAEVLQAKPPKPQVRKPVIRSQGNDRIDSVDVSSSFPQISIDDPKTVKSEAENETKNAHLD